MSSSTEDLSGSSTPKSPPRKRDRILKLFQKTTGTSRDANPPPIQGHRASAERPTAADKIKDGTGVVWSAVEASLRILNECSAWNPILKSVVGGIVACIDLVGVRVSEFPPVRDSLRILICKK